LCGAFRSTEAADGASARSTRGLVSIYNFSEGSGTVIHDRSQRGGLVDLTIRDPKAVKWTPQGLRIEKATRIESKAAPAKLINAVKRTRELTIEAWMTPANIKQDGPARMVSLSRDTSNRNVTLGQEAAVYQARLRTTKTSTNGIPSTDSKKGTANTRLTHVVFTRNAKGQTQIFLNGKLNVSGSAGGDFGNWDINYKLFLANEATGDRPWLGTLSLVAIYDRALSKEEVQQNFRAGARVSELQVADGKSANERLFDEHIAPIITEHCLECHDSVNHKGGLVLSIQKEAFAGGESGPALIAGKSSDSLIWNSVESDEMPHDRTPLTAKEKAYLKQWIDGGAKWTVDAIDPSVYEHHGSATQNWVRRLTIPEFIATVKSAVDVDIAKEARELLPPDLRADGFSNTAYNLSVDLKHIEAYGRLSEIIVSKMKPREFARRFSKKTLLTDDSMRPLVADMGKHLLRGPLSEDEVVLYRGISTTVASSGGDFEEAVAFILEAMLQSPRFIYRIETQVGDGTRWPVDSYELATRISYAVLGAPPDPELLKAADSGNLDRSGIEKQVQRLLKDPRARTRSAQFLSEWLDLDRLGNMAPNQKHFPNWKPSLAKDMRAESLAFFDDVVWKQSRPMSDLLNANITYLTPELAKHYGLPAKGSGQQRYDLKDIPERGGLLTQGSVLTVGGDHASMVSRGLFVLKDLLRGTVKDPPPCVDTTPKTSKAGLTQRNLAEIRIASTNCGGCHVKFEPLAFGLEKFDGLGSFHEKDQFGNQLRDDGSVLVPGTATPIPYKNSAELMDFLAQNQRVKECFTWKVTQFVIGRPLTAHDAQIVEEIHTQSQKNGGTYAGLMTAIVTSDLIRTIQTESPLAESQP